MGFLQRLKGALPAGPASGSSRSTVRRAQVRDPWEREVFGRLTGHIEVKGNLDLYDLIRELSPILDVAILKLVRLLGSFRLDALGNSAAQKVLDETMQRVPVGWFGGGFDTFMSQLADSALAKGFGVGELVPNALIAGIDRLKVARANDFRFMPMDGRLVLGQLDTMGFKAVELEDPGFIYYLAFDQRDGHPQGVSMLASLPASVRTMLRIQRAIETSAWRTGDPTFLILEQAGKTQSDEALQRSINLHLDDLEAVMASRRSGGLMDLGFGYANDGKLEVKVLGADARLQDVTVPTRVTMEQIVARTGLMPFMFGLSWSTTERMAAEQADMLASEIWSWRTKLSPIIERVFSTALTLAGHTGAKWKFEWDPVNLQDAEKTANARLAGAQALEKEVAARLQLLDAGLVSVDSFIDWLIENNLEDEAGIKQAGGREAVAKHYSETRGVRIAVALAREAAREI